MNLTLQFAAFSWSRFCPTMLIAIAVCLFAPNSLRAQTLGNAVDAPQLVWTTGGNQPWVGQVTVRHDGVDAASSGAIGDSQESWLQTTVTGPGTLAFWWKVSSEADYDFLEFQVNGSIQSGPISGEVDWQQEILELGAGSQTLRWRYYKDSSAASGQDRGWVDTVGFFPYTGPPVIVTQPASQTAEEGAIVTFEVVARGALPLTYQWYRGVTLLSGAEDSALTLVNLTSADAGQYTVRVQNSLNSITSAPALLTVIPATLDNTFDPATDGSVYAMAVQADGKILVGGIFTELGGQPRANLGRLHADGTLDVDFDPGAYTSSWGTVYSLQVQADGKILVGGQFETLGGEARKNLGRLNADGTADATFNPGVGGGFLDEVYALAVQADGKILVGGSFETLAGQSRTNIGRLNVNGTLDNTFVSLEMSGEVFSLALQPNGQILVGGQFTILNLEAGDLIAYFNLARLNTNGSVDDTYYPDPDGSVSCIVVQADGQTLVSGGFSAFNAGGQPREYIARINGVGDLATAFSPVADGEIYSIAIQTDGKILVAGNFTTLGGQPRDGIGRLNANGAIDNTFVPASDGLVRSLVIQGDGKVLVGGDFTTLSGQPRANLGRLMPTTAPTQSLNYVGTTITWLRGGTSPEAWRTTFEHSADGNTWTVLGAGSRVTGGWQRTGASIPVGNTIRARGYLSGGYQNASGSIVEAIRGKPTFLSQPASRTNGWGSTAAFTASAAGGGPFTYQWRKDNVALLNQGNTSGASSNTLTLGQVSKANEGAYRLVVSNSLGSVTSVVATLTVLDPFISEQPTGANRNPGESVTFNVTASGSPSLSYKWYQDGAQVSGAAGTSLALQNLSAANAGLYRAVVSNAFGSITSAPALLTVNSATLDTAFNPGTDGIEDPSVYSLALQADGKILVGGGFTSLSGQPRNRLGRLHADGTLDTLFDPGASGGIAYCLAVQTDGKILVGGDFTTLGGQSRSRIGRLNADGTLDTTFNPGVSGGSFPGVNCLLVQPDGKILVGGLFTTLAGQPRINLGRLNANGSLDTTFNPGASGGDSPAVYCLAVQLDGKIMVGGTFTTLGGQPHNSIGRLNSGGTLDTSFILETDNPVISILLQADGKILVGGVSFHSDGPPGGFIARFDTNGALDSVLNATADGPVYSLALQADGKILVSGEFSTLGNQPRDLVARLNSDGTLDSTFGPQAGGGSFPSVNLVAVQPDGNILVAGSFNNLGGQERNHIGRLNNTDPATRSLNYAASTITWTRGGTSPEVWRTSFEHSPDALTWTDLGSTSRTIGGWQLTGVSLPAAGKLRARGHVAGGGTGSWFVETILDLNPAISLDLTRDGASVILNWTGGQAPYQVQQSTDLGQPNSWQNVGSPTQNNSLSLPLSPDNLFLRIRVP